MKKIMMNMMMGMMKLVPDRIAAHIRAPMQKKARRVAAKQYNTAIKMNLKNLLICGSHCGTCPSKPQGNEALYCSAGKSEFGVTKKGCNCLDCELFSLCGSSPIGYFCIQGVAGEAMNANHKKKVVSQNSTTEISAYLQRFVRFDTDNTNQPEKKAKSKEKKVLEDMKDVNINFIDDKKITSNSNTTILAASLQSGIPHVHVCGGNARCSTCRVLVRNGINNFNLRNEKEAKLAIEKGFTADVRLACQSKVNGNVDLRRLVMDELDISEAINERRSLQNFTGKEVSAAILFADIRSFTSFSENNLPYDIVHILNRYFDTIGEEIDKNGGYIDKYIGDGIMAIFGLLKEKPENPVLQATLAAQGMLVSLNKFNQYLQAHFQNQFKVGIGIHYGTVIIGSFGYYKKKEFTAIGDTVNTASRIESLNKRTGSSVLLSDEAFQLVKDNFKWNKKYSSMVKGKKKPIIVHEPDFEFVPEININASHN